MPVDLFLTVREGHSTLMPFRAVSQLDPALTFQEVLEMQIDGANMADLLLRPVRIFTYKNRTDMLLSSSIEVQLSDRVGLTVKTGHQFVKARFREPDSGAAPRGAPTSTLSLATLAGTRSVPEKYEFMDDTAPQQFQLRRTTLSINTVKDTITVAHA